MPDIRHTVLIAAASEAATLSLASKAYRHGGPPDVKAKPEPHSIWRCRQSYSNGIALSASMSGLGQKSLSVLRPEVEMTFCILILKQKIK